MLGKILRIDNTRRSENNGNLLLIQSLREVLAAQKNCNVIKTYIGGKIREALVFFSPELSSQGKVEVFAYENLLDHSVYYKQISARTLLSEMGITNNDPLRNTESEIFAFTTTNDYEND